MSIVRERNYQLHAGKKSVRTVLDGSGACSTTSAITTRVVRFFLAAGGQIDAYRILCWYSPATGSLSLYALSTTGIYGTDGIYHINF